ncbi:STAS domain-containing protein [Streptomyces sp. NPDC047853]|uniref:STAS domain-containing protein n=1 Tax=unclassified Streptomyces TaxID=2593676 RepID=UPI0034566741
MAEEQAGIGRDGLVGGLSTATAVTGGVRIVTLAGEIDHHTGGQLRQALDLAGAVRPRIVIDMNRVTFMDSVGINILIAAHQDIAAAGGSLRLAAPTDAVSRVLQIVGIDQIIECHPTLSRALAL